MTTIVQEQTLPAILFAAQRERSAYQWQDAKELYTQGLSLAEPLSEERFDLLDGLAHCAERLADYRAGRDAVLEMVEIAKAAEDLARLLQARIWLASFLVHLGEIEEAREVAEDSLARARGADLPLHEAKGLYALGMTQTALGDYAQALNNLREAQGLFEALGELREEAMCAYQIAFANFFTGAVGEPHAERVLQIARQLDDRLLEGRGYHVLGLLHDSHPERSLRYHERALEIYRAIGEAWGISAMTHNLGFYFLSYGAYGRASELFSQVMDTRRAIDSRRLELSSAYFYASAQFEAGHIGIAYDVIQRVLAEAQEPGLQSILGFALALQGRVFGARGQLQEAVKSLEQAVEWMKRTPAYLPLGLGWLGEQYLESGDLDAALGVTAEAVRRAQDMPNPGFPEVAYWSRYRALRQASGASAPNSDEREVLQKGFEHVLKRLENQGDRGLRRSYLSRVYANPAILMEWARERLRAGEPLTPLTEGNHGQADIEQQFKRLLGTGTRLAAQTDPNGILDFIMGEFIDLSGAERAFIALNGPDGFPLRPPALSHGITPQEQEGLLGRCESLIDQAIRSRQVVLARDGGSNAAGQLPDLQRRSMIVVPLVFQSKAIGVLYADVRELFGPFGRQDADLLTLLANQAAAALENVRWSHELEERVRERTLELETINRIGEGLLSNLDLDGILEVVGEHVQQRFGTSNLFIAFKNHGHGTISFPYAVLDGQRSKFSDLPDDQGLTARVLETNAPMLIRSLAEMQDQPYVVPDSMKDLPIEAISWLGAPLRRRGEAVGALCSFEFRDGAYDESHLRMLSTIAANMGVALENARLFDELHKSNRELSAVIERQTATSQILQVMLQSPDRVQPVLHAVAANAARLCQADDVQLYRVVGESLLQVAHFGDMPALQDGEFLPLVRGLITGRAVLDQTTLHIYDAAEVSPAEFPESARLQERLGHRTVIVTPLLREGEAIGAIVVRRNEVKPFSEKQVALLSTFANQAAIAIENVRLFRETRRLLQETEERNAELAVINDVQRAFAAEMEVSSILEVVGEKLREIFGSQTVAIYAADTDRRVMAVEYCVEKGVRQEGGRVPFNSLHEHILRLNATFLRNGDFPEFAAQFPDYEVVVGEMPRSIVATPVTRKSPQDPLIILTLQDMDGERTFSEADVRLLETLANSITVALENARLFVETQRLLRDADARAADLSTINAVSQALVAETDMETLIQMAGERIRRSFDADIAYIALLDQGTGEVHFPYSYGQDFEPIPYGEGMTGKILQTGEALLINREMEKRRAEMGIALVGKEARSFLGVPIRFARETFGVMSVQSTREEGFFDEADLRLLNTIAANVGTAIRNAQLFDEMKRRKQYYEAVIENSPAAIVLLDNNASVTGWNPAAERLFGYTEEEVLRKNIDDLVAAREDLRADAVNYSQKALSEKRVHLLAKRTRKDGSLVDVEISALPVLVDNEQVGLIAIYHDVTELQRARQDAEQANRAKSEFLANMSHELRTPLNAIIGFTRIVRRKAGPDLPDVQAENLDKVLISAKHLLSLINTLLDLSKIEAGHTEIQRTIFELGPLAELALDTTRPLLQSGVRLEHDIPAELPALHSDQDKVMQILLNLLSNAAKFTLEGVITLRARQAGKSLHLEVQDTGIGIAPEALDRIFDEFQQADTSTTREYGGTGLGLTISRRLARLLGGDLSATSVEGRGSTFTLSLPLAAGQPGGGPREG